MTAVTEQIALTALKDTFRMQWAWPRTSPLEIPKRTKASVLSCNSWLMTVLRRVAIAQTCLMPT